MDTKLKIIEILQFILNVRLDYRITGLLTIFKREVDEKESSVGSLDGESAMTVDEREGIDLERIGNEAERVFGGEDGADDIDLDSNGGRTLLRVLLHLTMHDYPPLVSGSLQLLFRHFCQRQEVLQAFNQVQLLVSPSDVENYKQIKADLDELRLLVEKSELWVSKDKPEADGPSSSDNSVPVPRKPVSPQPSLNKSLAFPNIHSQVSYGGYLDVAIEIEASLNLKNYKTIQKILSRLRMLCVKETPGSSAITSLSVGREPGVFKKPRKHEQRLLRNMGAHQVVVDLLKIPYDKDDYKMRKIMRLAHEFLQAFCLGNQNNQMLMHKHIDLFLNPGLLEAQTLRSIFRDNVTLCNEINERVIQHFVRFIESHGKQVAYLKFLQTVVKADGQYIRKGQDMVMTELVTAGEDALLFYNDRNSFNAFVELMKTPDQRNLESGPLQYHVNLVKLLATCTEGKNVFTEIKCHSLLSLDDIIKMVTHPDCIPEVKEAYINFLSHCFIDTEVEMKEIYTSNHIWTLFENFLGDMASIATGSNKIQERQVADFALENYVCNSIMNLITTFFNSPFSDQSSSVQDHHPVFIRLLQGAFRLSTCSWLNLQQRISVENCIKSLADIAKSRNIVIPVDLENQVQSMFGKSALISKHTRAWLTAARTGQPALGRSISVYNQLSPQSPTPPSSAASFKRTDRTIIEGLQDIVALLEEQLRPLVQAELSVLVDILYRPEHLFLPNTEDRHRCERGGFISKLINHTERLLEEKEDKLCVRILETLKEMMAFDPNYEEKGEALRQSLLNRYFGKNAIKTPFNPNLPNDVSAMNSRPLAKMIKKAAHMDQVGPGSIILSRADMTLNEVQCHLDRQGASNLVVELIIQNPNQNIFLMSVELGIALLEGGNPVTQKSMLNTLTEENNSEKFFRIFYQKMVAAQQEIRLIVAATTGDQLISQKKLDESMADDNDSSKPKGKMSNQKRSPTGLVLTEDLKGQLLSANNATKKAYEVVKSVATCMMKSKKKPERPKTLIRISEPELTTSDIDFMGRSTPTMSNACDELPFEPEVIVKPDGTVTTSKSRAGQGSVGVGLDLEDSKLPPEVVIMQPILRFLQLLCENHNSTLQNFLRYQNNKNNYNMVSETLLFLDCICGSTTGGLGLLGLYINEKNVQLVNQTIETLTEYCQGPCHENQNCIAMHESNAIDIIIALILNDINPLGRTRMDLVLELKNNASKLLLAIMESRADSGNAERIMYNMSPRQLIEVACSAFHQSLTMATEDSESFDSSLGTDDEDDDEYEVTPKEVGHNIYILCHQLALHNKELAAYLKPGAIYEDATQTEWTNFDTALEYYRKHTAQIEIVRQDRTMERIVFPVPPICEYLTTESKYKIFTTSERDEQGSKVSDFFAKSEDLYSEMKWQKKLRGQSLLYYVSSHMSTWASMSFNFAVLINLIVACFYPFETSDGISLDTMANVMLWMVTIVTGLYAITVSRRAGWRIFISFLIWRLLISVGIQPTLGLVGVVNVLTTTIHLVSIMGNRGTFTKSMYRIVLDGEVAYHVVYLGFCILGLCAHPFFYSVLLLSLVYQEETLRNVIRSVTRNGRSIILTAVLAVILIYLFSIFGYMFFRDDFILEVSPLRASKGSTKMAAANSLSPPGLEAINATLESSLANTCSANSTSVNCTSAATKSHMVNGTDQLAGDGEVTVEDVEEEAGEETRNERACDSLRMCMITTLNQGLRNGGGIGDVLRPPSSEESLFLPRVVYDLLFYFVVIIIILNLIFGVIIDTFADLRSEKQQKEEILKNSCFICGLERAAFDNKTISFEEHVTLEHNMWHYLYFVVLVKVKDPTEFTGPESYVASLVRDRNNDWFPRMRTMSLDINDNTEDENNEIKSLQVSLEGAMRLVSQLSQQIVELRDQLGEERRMVRRGILSSSSSAPY
ncbi:Inositol 1,4,5-trisphosphate receptor type 1 [Halotydeus destructor]|nr:Inositol 1,4,5-trisphosphate receptor type 1 [Halotydeus destructor]